MPIGVSTPLRALSTCIAAIKWAPATKDLHGKRVEERVEKFAPKHKHRFYTWLKPCAFEIAITCVHVRMLTATCIESSQ